MSKKNKDMIKFTMLIAALLLVFGIQWKTLEKTETLQKALRQEASRFEGTLETVPEANK